MDKGPLKSKDDLIRDLATRAIQGDRESLRQLITVTKDELYKFLLFLCGDPQQANDLSQEAYLKVLGHITSLKEPDRFKSWLFKTAKNLFLDQKRSSKNKKSVSLDEAGPLAAEVPDTEVEGRLAILRQALNQVAPEDRLVLVCVDIESKSYAEAAEIIGISENALRSRLHRARQRLLDVYKKIETNPGPLRRVGSTD